MRATSTIIIPTMAQGDGTGSGRPPVAQVAQAPWSCREESERPSTGTNFVEEALDEEKRLRVERILRLLDSCDNPGSKAHSLEVSRGRPRVSVVVPELPLGARIAHA